MGTRMPRSTEEFRLIYSESEKRREAGSEYDLPRL
jgi:hypothetical protein